MPVSPNSAAGRWLALTAAILGWMFDGFEMGLFPLVAKPALEDLHSHLAGKELADAVNLWLGVVTAAFLIGAATGGVLFGRLGDRIGRVRAMTLSVLVYSLCAASCAFAQQTWQLAVLRFIAALGMGGEWALGVALIMEIWPNHSRALLAGLIGAAANAGYVLSGLIGRAIAAYPQDLERLVAGFGLSPEWETALTAHAAWRFILLCGAFPAVLTLFIRLFVPESAKWQAEAASGQTSHWATVDLWAVLIGAAAAFGLVALWVVKDLATPIRIAGSIVMLAGVTLGYLYPGYRFLQRSAAVGGTNDTGFVVRRMLLGACLSGVALLGTWASVQQMPTWAASLPNASANVRADVQLASAAGAILGGFGGALLGGYLGRRWAYALLCAASLAAIQLTFRLTTEYSETLLLAVFLTGGITAAFYGWLPLYLPELFGTKVRATGQGFAFNFGRVLAAVGVLQLGNVSRYFDGNLGAACTMMSVIYVAGLGLICFAPETHGKPLPD